LWVVLLCGFGFVFLLLGGWVVLWGSSFCFSAAK